MSGIKNENQVFLLSYLLGQEQWDVAMQWKYKQLEVDKRNCFCKKKRKKDPYIITSAKNYANEMNLVGIQTR